RGATHPSAPVPLARPPGRTLFPYTALFRSRGTVAALVLADHAVEPGALRRQAAGVLLVGGPVPDVLAATDDVPVAAQHVLAAAGQPLVEHRLQPLHDLELVALAQLAGGAGGDVERDHA